MEIRKPLSNREIKNRLDSFDSFSVVVSELNEDKNKTNKMQVITDFKAMDKQSFLDLTANDRNKLIFKVLKALCKIEVQDA